MRIIAHADWGSDPKKRWMCIAEDYGNGEFVLFEPEPVRDTATLLSRLMARGDGRVFVGFDFPIGVPMEYAKRIGIGSFKELLRKAGKGNLFQFFELAEFPVEITPNRPFYPKRPGGTKRQHLIDGIGVSDYDQLLRSCERRTADRGNACSLFWTLGGQQVGRAAIIGWREVLKPALEDPAVNLALWPFDGELSELLDGNQVVVAETYPAEAAIHIGLSAPGRGWSKRSQSDRMKKGAKICQVAESWGLTLSHGLRNELLNGFGPSKYGEDSFDATIGLLSMLAVMKGRCSPGTPPPGEIREIEGWILGCRGTHLSKMESLKEFREINNPDNRSLPWITVNRETGVASKATLEGHYSKVLAFKLHENVPEKIRNHFTTGLNLLLYTWHCYGFFPVAELHALTTLEFALRERIGEEGIREIRRNKKRKGLHGYLWYAIEKSLIKDEDFNEFHEPPILRAEHDLIIEKIKEMSENGLEDMENYFSKVVISDKIETKFLENLLNYANKIRNDYAHGCSTLTNYAWYTFGICAACINKLFTTDEKKA